MSLILQCDLKSENEYIEIGDDIKIRVYKGRSGQRYVKAKIDAPMGIDIRRIRDGEITFDTKNGRSNS